MPIIKSAKKRVKQSEKRRQRNYPVRSKMKTFIKKVLIAVKDGNNEEAVKLMPETFKIIDTATKKNIIHKNNAARKKSRLAKALANIGEAKVEKVIKKKPAAKKTTAKKVEKVAKTEEKEA
ncbi:30S ribosomal protein S20 [Patescibacteria group bacterium]|nr:30S ribosomal protein S20 [Patescibacteria group bacterium]